MQNKSRNYFLCIEIKSKKALKNDIFRKKMNYYKFPIFVRPFLLFLYRYILKRGFLDGYVGIKFCLMQTLYYRLLVDFYIAKRFLIKFK